MRLHSHSARIAGGVAIRFIFTVLKTEAVRYSNCLVLHRRCTAAGRYMANARCHGWLLNCRSTALTGGVTTKIGLNWQSRRPGKRFPLQGSLIGTVVFARKHFPLGEMQSPVRFARCDSCPLRTFESPQPLSPKFGSFRSRHGFSPLGETKQSTQP